MDLAPVRCFGCKKPILHYENIITLQKEGKISQQEIWKKYGIKRDCCKQIYLSTFTVDLGSEHLNDLLLDCYKTYNPCEQIEFRHQPDCDMPPRVYSTS